MSFSTTPSADATEPASQSYVVGTPQEADSNGFVDRRGAAGRSGGGERRQFGSSHSGLSDAGRELATAIDQYKVENHRRYITCDEMLSVLNELGYRQVDS